MTRKSSANQHCINNNIIAEAAWYNYDITCSGIDISNDTQSEFEGRAIWGTNTVDPPFVGDDVGHGTHVAGKFKGA